MIYVRLSEANQNVHVFSAVIPSNQSQLFSFRTCRTLYYHQYLYSPLSLDYHSRLRFHTVNLSFWFPPPPLPFTTGFVVAFIFQAIETLLATSFAVSNAANLDTGPRTVDPCSGREATSPLDTVLALESSTTSQPQANQFSQSIEDDLGQIDQIAQDQELKSGHSLSVKGNLKNNLGFWRSIAAPDFILSIIENGYSLPFISFPLAVKLNK